MNQVEWTFNETLNVYPAMNEYAPSKKEITIGIICYVIIWAIVLFTIINVVGQKLTKKIPLFIGFICGAIFIFMEYVMKFAKKTYFVLPDKKMYSTISKDNGDYKVIKGKNPFGKLNESKFGYIVSREAYDLNKTNTPSNYSTLTSYLNKLGKPISGKTMRKNKLPEIVDGYTEEMTGLTRSAYYISIIMITWIGYIYLTGKTDRETNMLSLISVLIAVISTLPILIPTTVPKMARHVLFRQVMVHLSTAFAIAALAERLIQK